MPVNVAEDRACGNAGGGDPGLKRARAAESWVRILIYEHVLFVAALVSFYKRQIEVKAGRIAAEVFEVERGDFTAPQRAGPTAKQDRAIA